MVEQKHCSHTFGEFFFEGLEEGFLCWVIVVFVVVGFWGKTSVEVCGGCGRCKRKLREGQVFFFPQFLKRL